jgi:membrane-associated HD superfamily phosphohydrolase
MGFIEALEDVLADEGPVGNMANRVYDGVMDFGNRVADALDDFAEKLGEIEKETASDNDEEAPDWDETPGLRAMKDAADSIVNLCDQATIAVNESTIKILEATEKDLDRIQKRAEERESGGTAGRQETGDQGPEGNG